MEIGSESPDYNVSEECAPESGWIYENNGRMCLVSDTRRLYKYSKKEERILFNKRQKLIHIVEKINKKLKYRIV